MKLAIFLNKIKNFFIGIVGFFKPTKEVEPKEIIKTPEQIFEEKYKLDAKKIKKLMFENTQKHYYPKTDYHNEVIQKGREEIIKRKTYSKGYPLFFDSDICDIHNENLDKNNPTFVELMKKEEQDSLEILKKQERKLNNKPLDIFRFFQFK